MSSLGQEGGGGGVKAPEGWRMVFRALGGRLVELGFSFLLKLIGSRG